MAWDWRHGVASAFEYASIRNDAAPLHFSSAICRYGLALREVVVTRARRITGGIMALVIFRTQLALCKRGVPAAFSVILSMLSGCGSGISTERLRGTSPVEDDLDGNKDVKHTGSAQFSLNSLHEAKKRGEPNAADLVLITYSRECRQDLQEDSSVSSSEQSLNFQSLKNSEHPDCEIGTVRIDLAKESVAKIAGLKPGKYLFEAKALRKDVEIKRGATKLEVRAGKVTRGSIILRESQGKGGVEIEIIDGGIGGLSPACGAYEHLASIPEPLRCQVGVFVCSYETYPLGVPGPDIIRRLTAKSECSDKTARLEILKKVCDGNFAYEAPIRCTNKLK